MDCDPVSLPDHSLADKNVKTVESLATFHSEVTNPYFWCSPGLYPWTFYIYHVSPCPLPAFTAYWKSNFGSLTTVNASLATYPPWQNLTTPQKKTPQFLPFRWRVRVPSLALAFRANIGNAARSSYFHTGNLDRSPRSHIPASTAIAIHILVTFWLTTAAPFFNFCFFKSSSKVSPQTPTGSEACRSHHSQNPPPSLAWRNSTMRAKPPSFSGSSGGFTGFQSNISLITRFHLIPFEAICNLAPLHLRSSTSTQPPALFFFSHSLHCATSPLDHAGFWSLLLLCLLPVELRNTASLFAFKSHLKVRLIKLPYSLWLFNVLILCLRWLYTLYSLTFFNDALILIVCLQIQFVVFIIWKQYSKRLSTYLRSLPWRLNEVYLHLSFCASQHRAILPQKNPQEGWFQKC